MSDRPTVDGRRQGDIREHLESIAPTYTDEWEPGTGDTGDAVLGLFAAMAGDVIERLDQAPEKHRVAFFDALGFDRRPPQSATVPATFTVAENAGENAAIPVGTELEAEADDGEVRFRVESGDGFEATPARLSEMYAVDPGTDRIVDHSDTIDGETGSTLFEGPNRQEHALYVGHPERLDVSERSRIELSVETARSDALAGLEWEYYGLSEVTERDGEAVEGWHELHRRAVGDDSLAFELDEGQELLESDVNGVESFWVRCRVSDGEIADRVDTEIEDVSFGTPENQPAVDGLYANDVPQPEGGTIYPFGSIPRHRDAFYVACEEAFTKRGGEVMIEFGNVDYQLPDADTEDVRLSWEYFDGGGWRRLPLRTSHGESTGVSNGIGFVVPDDIEATSVAGQESIWIRTRLVAGQFVDIRYEEESNGEMKRIVDGQAPSFSSVEVSYSYGDEPAGRPTHLFAGNNREYSANLLGSLPARPFELLPDASQTVYLGFNGPLRGGPIQLYADVADHAYPESFTPRLGWEYCVDPATDTWERLQVADGSTGLTESGLVSAAFPEETTPSGRFGHDRHWLRARVRGDPFDVTEVTDGDWTDSDSRRNGDHYEACDCDHCEKCDCGPRRCDCGPDQCDCGAELTRAGLQRCRHILGDGSSAGEPTTEPPHVRGIHLNAGQVSNRTVVRDELLGSSDGTPNTTLQVENPPVIDLELWVDEHTALSTDERARLEAESPERIDVRRDRGGDITTAWVRWEPVVGFGTSSETDRHYVIDRVAGTVTFGDGSAGRIPPHGRDNVRTTYRTGGGPDGNVAPGAIDTLASANPLVEAVTNPVAGSGGAPPESIAAVLDRAPRTLRDRGRAVTAADFERIAMDASRRLATVRCIRGMNRSGETQPGWVTLVIVPDDGRETPVPTAELRRRVRRTVGERAPLTLVSNDQLVVRGPSYVAVGVEATIVASDGERLGAVEDRVETRVSAFLHPLTGADGDGWEFGELPSVSDLFARIEQCEGVDHVRSLRLRFDGPREDVTVSEGDARPDAAPDVLVRSASHELHLEPYPDPCAEVE